MLFSCQRLLKFFIYLLVVFIFSCKKDTITEQPKHDIGRVDPGGSGCAPTTVTLKAGQTIDAGTVTVINDADFIYVTYTTANGYLLTQTHLYVGDCAAIPVNGPGNPMPGQFPYSILIVVQDNNVHPIIVPA